MMKLNLVTLDTTVYLFRGKSKKKNTQFLIIALSLFDSIQAVGVRENQCRVARQQFITGSKKYYECADKQSRKAASSLIRAFQKEYDRAVERATAAEADLIFVCRTFCLCEQRLVDRSSVLGNRRIDNRIPATHVSLRLCAHHHTYYCLQSSCSPIQAVIQDPFPYLEQVSTLLRKVIRLCSIDERVRNLTKQLNELQKEYGHLRNQDLTIRQLKERMKEMEAKTNSNVQAAINEREKELRVELETFEKEVTEKREQVVAENKTLSVADLTIKNKEINRMPEETKLQLVKDDIVNDEKLEIVTNDLENALQRAVEAEKEVQRLQGISCVSSSPNEGAHGGAFLIHSKDSQIHKLLEENKKLNSKLIHLKTESTKRIDELTQELERHMEIIAQLRAQLEAQSDYEDNKKDLRILRSIEFEEIAEGIGFVSNGVTATATATAEVQLGGRSKALDELLVGKNRKLQSENVDLRMRDQKLEEEQPMDGNELSDVFGLVDANFNGSTLADLFSNKSGQKSVETNGDLDLESDPHRATNLLNLFMCSASSSNDVPKLDNYYSASTSSLHELPRTPAELRTYNELQDIVTRNIHELGSKALNTTEIAKQCKHLMVTHNIGQRLFAKYVMNQVVKSQGSLSELLSKPRHWNKLTDKGREAFRRMYGWVSDPKAIELLCNISPRRTQPVGLIEIEVPSREILWDQQAVSLAAVSRYNADDTLDLFVQKQSSRAAPGDLKQRDRLSAAAGGGNANSVVQRTSRWRHDDIPKEKIMKIYKRELALLREQESHLEQAIGSRPLIVRSKDEKLATIETSNKSSSLSSSSSRCGSTRDTGSPLQSNFPVNSAQALFALKCRSGMASITQEELERYPVLDTEDIVRQIKDFLCLNSISQRQFGEYVLGLSQGSVSDLLARPKPWTMLTQKGREPFVRMQLFLNEAQSLVCKPEAELNGKLGAIQSSEVLSKNETNNGAKQNSISGLLSRRNFPLADEIDHETVKRTEKTRKIKKVCVMDDGDKKMMRNVKKKLLMADTSEIARQVKDRLHSSGISQKTFGDVVLGVSPGGVSELLAKPKTWEQLSPRARDLYLRMSEWLGELDGNRRVHETSTPTPLLSSSLTATFSNMVDTLASTGALTKSLSPQKRKAALNTTAVGELPKKAQRTVITDQQKEALKHVFERDQHPNQRTIEQLSQTLSLSTRTVSNWFHNYRTRQKASLRAENHPNGDNGQKRNSVNGKNNNDRWKQDLAELMKLESKPYHWSPTMVSSSSNSNLTRNTIAKNSSLDKAIERIQKLNAAKQL
ncbi:CUT domain-containing protein [Loa loa]|uniref:Homeobox protein cut-like n=1 Tax=Loa loa TaxID=7209 RepID=A0A1S0UAH4_LOALO|nr:CUT domain-containing protein [Loa loa]EFO27593.2 CUT domain-containing protein [Loa loa]